MQTIVSMVAAAIGVAVVPASITNVRIEGVVYKALQPQSLTAMTLAWRGGDPSPVLHAFVEVVRGVQARSSWANSASAVKKVGKAL